MQADKLYYEPWSYNKAFKMNIVILAALLVVTLVFQSNEAAMIPEHPQTAFCKADFGEALFYKTFIPCNVKHICIRHCTLVLYLTS